MINLWSLFILACIICVVSWMVRWLPFPPGSVGRNVVYILFGIFCILWLLDLGGFSGLGIHKHFFK